MLIPSTLAAVSSSLAAGGEFQADAISAASPNYRTFTEADLKSMRRVDGYLWGGHYTCSKNSDPFTYFEQDWKGVSLSYLLEVETGIGADKHPFKLASHVFLGTAFVGDVTRSSGFHGDTVPGRHLDSVWQAHL